MQHDFTDPQRKRLLWRATHRGIKEMDIVVGGFAERWLANLSDIELQEFEAILELPDQELLSWMTGQVAIPSIHDSQLLRRVLRMERS